MTMNYTIDLNQVVYQIAKLCLEQGSHQGISELAFSLSSRFYYAISLCPPSWLGKLTEESQKDQDSETMLRTIELASKLSYLLPNSISEPELSILLKDLCTAIAQSNSSIHLLLDRLNQKILEPLQSRLKPRKLSDFEEVLSKVFYPIVLSKPIQKENHYLPKLSWPNLSGYRLLQSLPKKGVVYPFLAERIKDGLRCLIEVAQNGLFMPRIDKKDWPSSFLEILEEGEYQGLKWIVMPYASSIYLSDLMPHLSEHATLMLGEHLLEALSTLHYRNHAHLDLNPSQIVVVIHHRLQLKLMPYEQRNAFRSLITQREPPAPLPTFVDSLYVSPEQKKGERGDQKSDLWSYASILYEALKKKPLFNVKTWGELSFYKYQDTQLIDFNDIHPLLIPVLSKCLSNQISERYQSATELLLIYQPLIKQIKESQKMAIRRDFWLQVVQKEYLLKFIKGFHRIEKDGDFIFNDFENHLSANDLVIPPGEDTSLMIQLLLALVEQKKIFKDELSNWKTALQNAQDAKIKLLEKIERSTSVQIFEKLEDFLTEKQYLKQKIEKAQNQVLFFQRNDLKIFYELLTQYLNHQGFQLHIKEQEPQSALIKEFTEEQKSIFAMNNAKHDMAQSVNFFKHLHQILDEQNSTIPKPVNSPSAILSSPVKINPQVAGSKNPAQIQPMMPPTPIKTIPSIIPNHLSPKHSSQPPAQSPIQAPSLSPPQSQAQAVTKVPASTPPSTQKVTASKIPYHMDDVDLDLIDQILEQESNIASSPNLTVPAKPIEPAFEDDVSTHPKTEVHQATKPSAIPPYLQVNRLSPSIPPSYIAPKLNQSTERISSPPPEIQPETLIEQEEEEKRQLRDLYDKFIELRKQCGESEIGFDAFSDQIHQARNQYIAVHGWTPLKFNAYIKNNKVALKAKPVKI